MCLTMARPHQTERRKLEASNVAVNLGFGNIKVCQFCQPPRFCRLHWMALPNRHPTHQPPVISPSSARHQPPWLSAPHREPINVWSGRHTSGDCFSEALSNIPKTAKTNTAAMARNIHEIWIVLYCATLFWKRLTAV